MTLDNFVERWIALFGTPDWGAAYDLIVERWIALLVFFDLAVQYYGLAFLAGLCAGLYAGHKLTLWRSLAATERVLRGLRHP